MSKTTPPDWAAMMTPNSERATLANELWAVMGELADGIAPLEESDEFDDPWVQASLKRLNAAFSRVERLRGGLMLDLAGV